MAYKRIDIDLTNAQSEPKELVPKDKRISEVIVLKGAGALALQFGNPADALDVDAPLTFQPTGEESRNGLYASWAAQAGIVQTLYVVFSGGALNAELEKV